MDHREHTRSATVRHTVALPQEPTPLAPPGWTDWQLGLQREILRLINQKNSSIREEISDRVDEVLLRTTLEATGGNISQASHRLGISRPTLRSRLRQLKIATPNSPT